MPMLKDKQLARISPSKIKQDSSSRMVSDVFITNAQEVHVNAQRKNEKDVNNGYAGLTNLGFLNAMPNIKQITKLSVKAPKSLKLPIPTTMSFLFPDLNVLRMVKDSTSILYSCDFDNTDKTSFIPTELVSFYGVMRLAQSVTMSPTILEPTGSYTKYEYDLRTDIQSYNYEPGYDMSIDIEKDICLIRKPDGTYRTCLDLLPLAIVPDLWSSEASGYTVSATSSKYWREPWEPYRNTVKNSQYKTWMSENVPSSSSPEIHTTLFDVPKFIDSFEMTSGGFNGNSMMPSDFKVQVSKSKENLIWIDSIEVNNIEYNRDYESKKWKFHKNNETFEAMRIVITKTKGEEVVCIPKLQIYGANSLTYNNIEDFTSPTIDDTTINNKGIKSPKGLINALNSDLTGNYTLLVFRPTSGGNIQIPCTPTPRMVYAKSDIDISNITGIVSTKVLIPSDAGTERFILSVDKGENWLTWTSNQFVEIDSTDISAIKSDGITKTSLEAITEEQWKSISSNTIRFGYYLENNVEIDSINFTVRQKGTWSRAVIGRDYEYHYSQNNELEVKLLLDGDYKINYYG